MESFKGIEFKGREVRIEVSGEGTSSSRSGGSERREGSYNRSGGSERREGGYNRSGGPDSRRGEGGYRGSPNPNSAGGFRDFSGKRREDRPERRRRF